MRTKYKPWALPYLKEHQNIAFASFNQNDSFYNSSLCLEIGGGKGDFIVGLAKMNPKTHYLMIERVISVAAPAVKKVVENELSNVYVIYDNFINVIRDIPNSSVNKIYLNFSDPWPKKKHAKRRLTAPSFMLDYYRILKKKGEILIKTDQKILYDFTKIALDQTKFQIIVDNSNYNKLDKEDVLTEYENKFRSAKKTIYRLVLRRL